MSYDQITSLVTMIITIIILKCSKDVQDKNFLNFYKLHQIHQCFFNLNVYDNNQFLCFSIFDCIFDFFCLVFSIEQFSLRFLQLSWYFLHLEHIFQKPTFCAIGIDILTLWRLLSIKLSDTH